MRHFFLGCCLLLGWYAYAQAPIKITIYGADSTGKTQHVENTNSSKSDAGLKNLLKWNYTLLGRGAFVLNYERHIANKFTFEFGGGITYSDFIFTTYYEIGSMYRRGYTPVNSSNGSSQHLLLNPFENSIKGTGFAIETSPKMYFEKDEFEGFYVSPYLAFRKYNYSVTAEDRGAFGMGNVTRNFDLSYTHSDFGFKLGYQYYFSDIENLYYDFYFGLTYRKATVNTLMVTEDQSQYSTTHTPYTQQFGYPAILFGAKLGLAF
jgi:hypothetical protein